MQKSKTNCWQTVKLKDICKEITVGFVGSMANEYVNEGIPFLRSQNILPFSLNLDGIKFITPEFHKKIKKSSLSSGDVAIVRTGYPGTACVIPESLHVSNCSDLVIVRPSDELDAYYLSCIFNSTWGKKTVAGNLVGAAQQHFNVGAAKEMIIRLPPISIQKRITSILSAYDDLIENNTRRIKIIEEMAQMLYREWFINFRFPNHENVKMVESELGLIPEGWEVKRIKDLGIKIIDGDRSKRYPKSDEFQSEGILFLSTKNITDNKLDLSEANYITTDKFSQISKGRLQSLDIVMTTRGSIGKIALFNCNESTGLINAQMLILRADNETIEQLFLFCLMSSEEFQDKIKSFASGSAQPQIPIQDLREIDILYPTIELQKQFSNYIGLTH